MKVYNDRHWNVPAKVWCDDLEDGAGRNMSRTKAKKELNLEDEAKILDDQGIVHDMRSKDRLDEAPSAYKNIEDVMEAQKDLVKILVTLNPMAVIKG